MRERALYTVFEYSRTRREPVYSKTVRPFLNSDAHNYIKMTALIVLLIFMQLMKKVLDWLAILGIIISYDIWLDFIKMTALINQLIFTQGVNIVL